MKLRFTGLALIAVAAFATSAKAQVAYVITGGGTSLSAFNINTPGSVLNTVTISGGFLDAIDFRPSTGQLFGYSDLADTLYTVNTSTGALTVVASGTSASGTLTNGFAYGLDFNPMIDRVRLVNDSNQNNNLVYNPGSNAVPTVATNVFYAAGDVNAGVVPLLSENAYTNNLNGAASTQQYAIDAATNSLVTLANNAGTLGTVGALTLNGNAFNVGSYVGFDIFTSFGGVNTAYLLANGDTTPSIYTVNLANGTLTSVGTLGTVPAGNKYSLAVTPSVAPEPGTFALAALGVVLVGTIRRRRAK